MHWLLKKNPHMVIILLEGYWFSPSSDVIKKMAIMAVQKHMRISFEKKKLLEKMHATWYIC